MKIIVVVVMKVMPDRQMAYVYRRVVIAKLIGNQFDALSIFISE